MGESIEDKLLERVKESLKREDISLEKGILSVPDYSLAKKISISEHTKRAEGMAVAVSSYQSKGYKGDIKVGKEGHYQIDFWFTLNIEHPTVSSAKVHCRNKGKCKNWVGQSYSQIITMRLTTELPGTNIGWGSESYSREMIINHPFKTSELVAFYREQGVNPTLLDEMIEVVCELRRRIPKGEVELTW